MNLFKKANICKAEDLYIEIPFNKSNNDITYTYINGITREDYNKRVKKISKQLEEETLRDFKIQDEAYNTDYYFKYKKIFDDLAKEKIKNNKKIKFESKFKRIIAILVEP